MATNNYTTKTAALKATKANVTKLETKSGTIGTLNSTTGDVNTLTVKTINGAAPIVEVKSGDNGYTGGGVETRTSNNKTTVTISTNQTWMLSDGLPIAEALIVRDGKAIMANGSKIDIDTNMIYWIENRANNLNYTLAMQEWYGDMMNLEKCYGISLTGNWYYACRIFSENLTTFVGDMPIATELRNMFADCKNLTTFIGDLGSLRIGGSRPGSTNITTGMFTNTNLTLDSVENIADGINDLSAMTLPFEDPAPVIEEGLIGISWYELPTDTELQNKLVDALNDIVLKGWQVATNDELVTIARTKGYIISTGAAGSPGFFNAYGLPSGGFTGQ